MMRRTAKACFLPRNITRQLVEGEALMEQVAGSKILSGVKVFEGFVSKTEELRLAEEAGVWMESGHCKKGEVNVMEFAGKSTRRGLVDIVSHADNNQRVRVAATQHARQADTLMAEIRRMGIIESSVTAFRFKEYLTPTSGSAPVHKFPSWQAPFFLTVSLLSAAVMRFDHHPSASKVNVYLPPRSLLVCEAPGSTEWSHCIPRTSVSFNSKRVLRDYRLSIDFYKLNTEGHDLVDVDVD